MTNKSNFFKDLLDFPMIIGYILFKSTLAPILWLGIIVGCVVFGYIVITG